MKKYCLQSYVDAIHTTFPAAKRQPVIGITTNYQDIDACVRDRYYKQVIAAGGTPLLIPPVADKEVLINTLEHLDGLLLTGGGDYNPLWAGEEPSSKLGNINKERDLPELLLTRLAYHRQIPMLGICRGIQTLATALHGKVAQDIQEYALAAHLPSPTARQAHLGRQAAQSCRPRNERTPSAAIRQA